MANPANSTKSIDQREYEVVCRLLRALRTRAKLSQKELGERLNRPQTYVSDVELAGRRLDALQLRAFAQACGSSFTEFARRLDEALEVMPPPLAKKVAKKVAKKAPKKTPPRGE
ncbi:helix-turn-helix transcriptional regulator [Dyella sp. 2HG41-7]|uniref:helix-turn-helix domain-containing protein n=1 Tax=Dyella sp. 2HG41-7 TaxID=2883239 RepID=UPI001F1D4F54|nr:helix-turn-helix transcriptional regulator [Dyella sp. 2HG41-7]